MSTERQKLFWVWSDMKSRCYNKKHKAYKNYGGRGISVCKRWMSFEKFLDDMCPRPSAAMIERKNNNNGYSPQNCVWETRKEQNSNRRNCIYVEVSGEIVTLKEACRRRKIKYRPVHKRIGRGWPIDIALTIPLGSGKIFTKRGKK